MARAVGSSGRVICFEPLPQNLDRLRQNIELNKLRWVQIEPFAISSSSRQISMTFVPGNAGHSHVSSHGECRASATTFDDWIAKHSVKDISVCKIDVEGHENDVFVGMKEALSYGLIPVFVFEHHNASFDDPILQTLRSFNYKLMKISKGFRAVYYDPIDNSHSRGKPTADFLAIREGSELEPLFHSGHQ